MVMGPVTTLDRAVQSSMVVMDGDKTRASPHLTRMVAMVELADPRPMALRLSANQVKTGTRET